MSQSTHSTTKRNIFWFRRDLRLADNPALLAAIENSDEIVAVYILDEKINKDSGAKRLAYLGQSLRALDESLNNKLHVISGDHIEVLKTLIKKYGVDNFNKVILKVFD
jgi:deoxyribodipyrimidine photo-lyase